MTVVRLRPAVRADGAFLADMLVEAANWRPGSTRPRFSVLESPSHARYIAGWMRPGDAGFLALDDQDEPVGAAWYRVLPRSEAGFGYIAAGVPELVIGVRPIWRAQGVGRMLLRRLIEQARAAGYGRLSLSVEHGNVAATLYRSEGFTVAASSDTRDTMVRRLH